MKEHNDFILELPNFVPRELCERIIKKFEQSPHRHEAGKVNYNGILEVIPELKNSTEACACCDPNMKDEHREIVKYMEDAEELYFRQLYEENNYKQPRHMFDSMFTMYPSKNYTPVIQRQSRGSKYAWHFDGGYEREYATMMIYLNTLEPEEGGCTEFYYGRKVRPECGKVIIWPSNWSYPHCGNEVKGDYKYTIVSILSLQKTK